MTRCDCFVCQKKNTLMVKVHESRFRLLQGQEFLAEYHFHTRTARHFFCNVYCLEGFHLAGIPVREAAGSGMP